MINIYSCNWCSGHFLEMNYRLIKSINPNLEFRWIICNHSPKEYNDIIHHDEYIIFNRKNDVGGRYSYGMGSVAHGRGLNFLLEKTKEHGLESNINIVIDPDFYCFFSIEEILNLAEDQDCQIIGVGYPKRFHMFKLIFNFPTAIFSLFRKINFESLDFSANLHNNPPVGGNLDPTGLREDVGYKILLDAVNGKYKTVGINDNILDNFSDVYFLDDRLFGIHFHTFRDQNIQLVNVSDQGLANLENLYYSYAKDKDNQDFSFIDNDMIEIISKANESAFNLKIKNLIPKNV